MDDAILKELYKPFTLKSRPGQGGKTFKYVPSNDIIDRINKIFKGNWTTTVVDHQIIEDNILVLVRVCVTDNDGKEYCQEGFASQPIARFTYGDRSGKIIDIGNSYKSAMSKAIKTAVSRWGIGLYLEKESEGFNDEVSDDDFVKSNIPTIPINPSNLNSDQTNADITNISTQANTTQNTQPMINIPPIPEVKSEQSQVQIDTPPVFTDDSVITSTQEEMSGPIDFNPPTDSLPKSNEIEKLTEVQKVAIDNLISIHGKSFKELASAALGQTNNLPNSIDDLSYKDAVKIIQYGNNLSANM